jgi:2-oxoglutarate dehydrogenase E2 component (dihydrolipoamide succinyltransferase)
MSVKIVVPELGESVLEATVQSWHKKEGERVEVGETVVELETEKVNLDVGATAAGVLTRIEAQEGQDVKVGDVLGLIDVAEEGAAPDTEPPPEREVEDSAGEESQADEKSGVQQGKVELPKGESADSKEAGALTPVAMRLAQERGVDLSQVKGTGPGGRVTRADIENYLERSQVETRPSEAQTPAQKSEEKPSQAAPKAAPGSASQAAARPGLNGAEERIKMSRRRRTIARRLVEAQQTAAMLSTFNEIDMSAVMELRKRRNPSFQERHDVKLGFTSFFVKASIGALKAFPRLNAEVQGDEMVLKHYYDIGIAVGDPEGLVVPVLRSADRMAFAEIERQVKDYARKAQEGSLSLEDLQGGTFTITNGGVFGSLLSTPILSYPQVAILGLHKIENRPVAVDNQIVIRPMMYAAVSYDHRIVDGREAVQFLVRIKELIEDPETLLLEG